MNHSVVSQAISWRVTSRAPFSLSQLQLTPHSFPLKTITHSTQDNSFGIHKNYFSDSKLYCIDTTIFWWLNYIFTSEEGYWTLKLLDLYWSLLA